MGGSPSTSTSTLDRTTSTTPYAPAQGSIDAMLTAAQGAYAATPKTPAFSGPNTDQTAAIDYLRGQAPGMATGSDALRTLATDQISGKYLDPNTNPFIKGVVDAALRPVQQQLGQNIVSISDASQLAGAYGGDRDQLLRAKALNNWANTSADTTANIYGTNYANERNIQQGSGALLDQANNLALQPGKVLSSIGDQEQSWTMAQIAAQQQAPWTGLDNWSQILSQVQPYSTQSVNGTDTSTATAAGGGLGGAAKGALGGAAAGSAFGPWGAAIGGVVGGLGGLFG